MKRKFLIALPTMYFLVTGQFGPALKQFFSVLFLVLTVIFYFVSRNTEDQYHSHYFGNFKSGMLLLGMVVLICSAFPVGGYLAEPLIMPHSDQNADAIVVLASGATMAGEPGYSGFQRVTHGLRLLQENRAPMLLISTGYASYLGHAEAAWVASFTSMFAVDHSKIKILVSKDIVTTATEAEYLEKMFAAAGLKKILLVTSNGHIFRSVHTFARKGFEVLPAPVHTRESVLYASESYLTSLHAAIHEWIGIIYYAIRGRI